MTVQLPAGRYGPLPSTQRRRRTTAALAGAGLLLVAVVVWLGLRTANPAVTWKDVGFEVHDDQRVTVVFDVIRADPSVPVVCRVQALNAHYGQVGVVSVEIGPGERGAQRERVEVATSELAVTGLVDACQVRAD